MEDLAILIDGRPLRYYGLGHDGFTGGTETYVKQVAHLLAERGHTVHVITPDLVHEEQRGATEWWWGAEVHPQVADVVMAASTLETIGDLSAPMLVMLPNGVDPLLFGREGMVDAYACFSENHIKLMTTLNPGIRREQCFLTGLGVSLVDFPYPRKTPPVDGARKGNQRGNRPAPEPPAASHVYGRMLFSNDPARGLLPTLDIFERVRAKVPDATLHIGYDFNRQWEFHRWSARTMAEYLWECKRRIETTPGVVSLGGLDRASLVREVQECHVYAYPSDPPNTGSQIHGMLQMELAAAGCPLILSDIEAFPEVFGDAATLLPVVGSLRARQGDSLVRVDAQDWADVVIALMKSPKKWQAASKASRALAERHTWDVVVARMEDMLGVLLERLNGRETPAAA